MDKENYRYARDRRAIHPSWHFVHAGSGGAGDGFDAALQGAEDLLPQEEQEATPDARKGQ